MEKIKISLIATTLNESGSISCFLQSITKQTRFPDEIIIVDGGSRDNTLQLIHQWAKNLPNVKIIEETNINIAAGRNIAIANSRYDYIAVSDAGCILDSLWLQYLIEPFNDQENDIVAGWYQMEGSGSFSSVLKKIIGVPLSKINPQTFMPSSRSIAFKKECWETVQGYPENLRMAAEDTLFNLKLKKIGCQFIFQPKAFVFWLIPTNHRSLYKKFYNYAYGDAEIWNNIIYYLLVIFIALTMVLSPFIFFLNTFLFAAAVGILALYFILPLFTRQPLAHISNSTEFFLIFTCRITIFFASFFGFCKGVLSKI